jgi:heat shock protein HslJ
MHPGRNAFTASSIVLATVLTACGTTGGGPNAAAPAAPRALPRIDAVEWRCTELTGPGGAKVDVTDRPPSLRIGSDGRATGFAGVNRFFAEATFGNAIAGTPEPLRFGPIGATRMAGPPERMELERAFTAMVEGVRSAAVSAGPGGPILTLSGDAGPCARFEPSGPDAER